MRRDDAVAILDRLWANASDRLRNAEVGRPTHLSEAERVAIAHQARSEIEALDMATKALDPERPWMESVRGRRRA